MKGINIDKAMKSDKTDFDSHGNKVRWEVELRQWKDLKRKETEVTFRYFSNRGDANVWIKERLAEKLAFNLKITRLTYDRLSEVGNLPLATRYLMKDVTYDRKMHIIGGFDNMNERYW